MTCPGLVPVSTWPLVRWLSPSALPNAGTGAEETRMLFVGDDWAEDHHDVEVRGEDGRRLARARLPEGIDGLSRRHTPGE